MSTDATTTPLLDAPRKGYAFYECRNSNRSRRRGLCGPKLNWKTGQIEIKNHTTIRTIRFPDGGPLPHVAFPASRSRYTPHVGAKQLAKAAR